METIKEESDSIEDKAGQEEGKPIDVRKKNQYNAFKWKGDWYKIDDSVLVTPENVSQKADAVIIKKITKKRDGDMMLTCQVLYRPENAEKRNGGRWEAHDNRELFYSSQQEEIPAACLMHKCVVHFLPLHKQLPVRSQHPGFIVQRVYDTAEKKLYKLTDKDYVDSLQHEIDLLLQKTKDRLGDLLDIGTEETALEDLKYHQSKNERLDVSRTLVDATKRSDHQHLTVESTPGSHTGDTSGFNTILANFKALTGDTTRDKWLEKLLQVVQSVCDDTRDRNSMQLERKDTASRLSQEKDGCGTITKYWPAAAVSAVVSLEQASHGTLSYDFKKYCQKMRQLRFNLKNNERLARRLVKGELAASVILNMSPIELREGCLTTEEMETRNEPAEEEPVHIQKTDDRCSRCGEKKVGLKDIIKAGLGERYLFECTVCGNTWYASSR